MPDEELRIRVDIWFDRELNVETDYASEVFAQQLGAFLHREMVEGDAWGMGLARVQVVSVHADRNLIREGE